MSCWITRRATIRSSEDARLWASVTVSIRPSAEGLKVVSRLIPGKSLVYQAGDWSERYEPALKSEWDRLTARLRGPDPETMPAVPLACEAACLSGVFFAKHVTSSEEYEVEILDLAGCVTGDATPFAVATTAGVAAAVNPRIDLSTIDWGSGWQVSDVRAR
jgi:hypothetical protein